MIRVGLIGKIDSIETVVSMISMLPDAHVIGKVSSGMLSRQETPRYSIPELNRAELVERSDVLILTEGAHLVYDQLIDIIKRSKSLLSFEYFHFSQAELNEAEKLQNESNSVVQFHNPFYYHPDIQWIRQNFRTSAYFDLNYSSELPFDKDLIVKILLFPVGFLGVSPLKYRHMNLMLTDDLPGFINIRFEYSDSSVMNFNFCFSNPVKEFSLKGYSGKHQLSCNLLNTAIEYDQKLITLEKASPIQELNDFFLTAAGKIPVKTGISQYGSILRIITEIGRKSSWPEF